MKTIKPLRLGTLTRIYELGAQPYLVVTAIAFFPLDAGDALIGEQEMWITFMREAGPVPSDPSATPTVAAYVLDEGLPKARGEVLVRGFAHPPGGAAPGCAVRVVVGPAEAPRVDKRLMVSGDRKWDFMGMSMPTPFEKMPVDWSHAFGGPDHKPNPLGRGIAPVTAPDGTTYVPLPNVELEGQRVKNKGDRPRPGGFAPLDPTHPSRMAKMGTFDKRWLDTEYPGMPSDMHLEAFNTAPEDQRIEGYFAGGEPFSVENMHPTRPKIEGHLPALKARAFYAKRGEPEGTLHEVGMRLETVQLLPHVERGIVVYRGLAKIDEDDGHDVTHVMLAAERLGEPRDLDHYRAVFRKRTDREQGALAALEDRDLLPDLPRWQGGDGPIEELQRIIRRDGLLEQNMTRRAARQHARMVEEVKAAGLDPKDFGVPDAPPTFASPPVVALDDVAAAVKVAEERERQDEADAEEQRKRMEARGRALCEEHGVDYDALVGAPVGGPPTFRAEAELAKIRQAVRTAGEVGVALPELERRAADPVFEQRLVRQEVQLKELYRDGAHFQPAARAPEPDAARTLGGRVVAAHAGRLALADQDLTGADLEDAALAEADLSLAFLELARLDRADLRGADLRRAVLARASLCGADLTGANLAGANLGEADLTDANLTGADLTGAILFRAKVHGTTLDRAILQGTDFWETELRDVSLVEARLSDTTFLQATIERARATGAFLHDVTLLECKAPGLDLAGAHVEGLSLVTVSAPDASFRGATLESFSALADSSLPRADFRGATLRGASLRGSDLQDATFEGADLGGASVRQAKLLDVIAQKATLGGAVFDGSNLFQADLAGARGDDRTSFAGANVGRIRRTRRTT